MNKEKTKKDLNCLSINIKDNQTKYIKVLSSHTNIKIRVAQNIKAKLVFMFFDKKYKNLEITGNVLKNSFLEIINIFVSENLKIKQNIKLKEEFSSISQESVVISKKDALQDISYLYENNKSKTSSKQEIIAVGYDNSKTSINCVGKIHKKAIKAENSQILKGINQNDSTIELDPILLIDENDVIASHSATVGNISKDEIYYLLSRGIDKKTAERLIIFSNIAPILSKIEDKEVLQTIKNKIGVSYE